MEVPLLSDLVAGQLDRQGPVPLYRQLYAAIQRAVADGRLAPGQKLPSTRALAAQLGVSRVTVVGAYAQLQDEGCVVGDIGSGTYVAATGPARAPQVRPAAPAALSRRGAAILRAPVGIPEFEGAFVPGVPDVRNFPHRIWRRLQARYSGASERSLMGYANQGGYLPLRRALAQYLRISRSVRCTPDQIVITIGTNQSLDLCARLLGDDGDWAYVENPCHWGARAVLAAAGLTLVPVPVDGEGMLPPPRPEVRPRLLYVTPSHQFPLGPALSPTRRRHLLELARAQNLWILEDDYDSEFRYDGASLPSLQGTDRHGRVIYMGTFSKVMYSGMRLSYVVVPEALASAFSGAAQRLYRPGHLPLQAAVADFMLEGHFAAHIRRMRDLYAHKQAELRAELARRFGPALALSGGHAGLHLAARFGGPVDLDALEAAARERDIVLRRLGYFDCREPAGVDGFLLGYGAIEPHDIAPAVRRLADLYETTQARAGRAA